MAKSLSPKEAGMELLRAYWKKEDDRKAAELPKNRGMSAVPRRGGSYLLGHEAPAAIGCPLDRSSSDKLAENVHLANFRRAVGMSSQASTAVCVRLWLISGVDSGDAAAINEDLENSGVADTRGLFSAIARYQHPPVSTRDLWDVLSVFDAVRTNCKGADLEGTRWYAVLSEFYATVNAACPLPFRVSTEEADVRTMLKYYFALYVHTEKGWPAFWGKRVSVRATLRAVVSDYLAKHPKADRDVKQYGFGLIMA